MKSQTTTIYVNPIPRISAQGRHKQLFTLISKTGEAVPTTAMNKNKEFGVPSEYSFRLNPNTNKLTTGLDKLIENPFKGLEPSSIMEEYSLGQEWLKILEQLVKQEQIKLQTKFEIMDNVAYNFYTSDVTGTIFQSNWKANLDKPRNFLETFKIILYDGPNSFSDDSPRGRLALALIKNHPKIAKTKVEANTAVHDWYISEENEALLEKVKKRDVIEDAIWKWGELKNKSTPYIIYQLGSLLKTYDGNVIIKGKMNDASVKSQVSDYLNDSTSHQMDNIEKFNKLYSMLETKDDKQRFQAMYIIQQALNTSVIGIRDGFYIWHSKSAQDNIYKHTSYDALVSTIQREYVNYNPKDTVANWYKDLYDEVSNKGAWVE
jgi:hypothetical protein